MKRRIVVNPQILVGKPVIEGTRIPVSLIVNLIANGYTVDRVVEAYPILTKEDVMTALEYAQAVLNREDIHPLIQTA